MISPCSFNGGTGINRFLNVDNPTVFWAVPVAFALHCSKTNGVVSHIAMLMYGKEASNRKQEIDRQHYTIPNQRPKDKHCGKI